MFLQVMPTSALECGRKTKEVQGGKCRNVAPSAFTEGHANDRVQCPVDKRRADQPRIRALYRTYRRTVLLYQLPVYKSNKALVHSSLGEVRSSYQLDNCRTMSAMLSHFRYTHVLRLDLRYPSSLL